MGAPKSCSSPYESARNQRVEENKRRLQELGVTDLSKDLSNSVATTRPSPKGRPRVVSKEKVTVQLRRSTRHAGGEQPDYVEVEVDIRRRARFDNTGGTRQYSRLYERKYASEEARMSATEKAEALKKMLPPTHASFVKPMLQSHVTGGFWLGLPVAFCRDYLPKKDDRIVLEDDKNEEWETIYLSNKTGLSGGWRGFSLDHGLIDGDALVFELVEPKKFKVHIIRVYGTNAAETESVSDVMEHESEAVEKVNANKVRQKLIWVTEPGKDNKMEENRAPNTTLDGKTEIDIKPNMHSDKCSLDNLKENVAYIEDSKNADFDSVQAGMLVDIEDCRSVKRLKGVVRNDNNTVKKEVGTSIDDNIATNVDNGSTTFKKEWEMGMGIDGGLEAAKKMCFNTNEGRDMTSYMRSRKHAETNVKKDMQSSNKGIGVC